MKRKQDTKIKIVLIVVSALFLGVFLDRVVLSQTGNTLKSVVEPGSMTSEASYIIFTDGTNIYARNGTTGEIEFSSTNASYVIQSAIDSLTNGGLIHIKAGQYNITNTITLNANEVSTPLILEGEGFATQLVSAVSSSATIRLFNSSAYPELIIRNLFLSSSSYAAGRDGIFIDGASFALVEGVMLYGFDKAIHVSNSNNVKISDFVVNLANYGVYTEYTAGPYASYVDTLVLEKFHVNWCNTGIYLYAGNFIHLTDGFLADNVISIDAQYDVYQLLLDNVFFEAGRGSPEVYLEGASWADPLRIITFRNCRWTGSASTTDAVQVGYATQVKFENCRSLTHTNFINSRPDATTNERKITVDWQCLIYDTNIANNLGTLIINNPYFVTENSGSWSGSSPVYVAHGLAGTPNVVSISVNATQPYSTSWTANSTHITIYYNGTGSLSGSWEAKYQP